MVDKISRTILISIDGLRGDFCAIYDDETVSNLKRLAREGCHASNVMNQFCTLTLPNHVSLITGLHAQNHGFVSNCMYDPGLDEFWTSWRFYDEFKNDDHEKPKKIRRWWDNGLAYPGEPFWQTLANQGGGKSGIYEWPAACGMLGSCDPPPKLISYEGEKSIFKRIDKILSWLEGDCQFIAFYIPELDTIQHEEGPFSPKTKQILKEIDAGIGYLVSELKRKNLWQVTNLVLTSDHGHFEIDPNKIVSLDRFVDKHLYLQKDLSFWPMGCSADALYSRLESVPNCRVYWRNELNKEHYSDHPRIGPIVVVRDPGSEIVREGDLGNRWAGRSNHGYDPFNCQEMRPFLICTGPAFKPATEITHQIDQTDIYLILCHCFSLRPAPCNGDIARIAQILAN